MSPFKPLGVLSLAGGVLALLTWFGNSERVAHGGQDLGLLLPAGLYLIVVGCGLLYRRRWAAILLAAPCALIGLRLLIDSLLQVPMPWLLINVALVGAYFVPALVTFRHWSELSKRWL
jgi:hypothetical protein